MSREMKHSGIEWIGEIPKEWEVCRFKFVSKMYTGNSLNEQQKEKYSNSDFHETLPYIATKDVERDIERIDYDGGIRIPSSSDNFVIAPRNSVLLCIEGGSAGKKVGYTNQDVFFVNKLCCFTTDKNSRFLYYFILSHSFSEPFSQNLQGLIGGVSVSALRNFVISIPPLPEQQKIADYLDKVCGEVDELVVLQEKMIEELKAYKQSVITEAVTKGLNPNAPMKNSGIDWIGKISEHWKVIRIKYLLKERKERSVNGVEEPLSMSQKYGLIPTKDMEMIPNMASSFVGAKLVYKNDLVFNKLKAHLGVFAVSDYEGLVSPDYAVYSSTSIVNEKYLEYLFKTPQYIGEFIKLSSGVGAGLTRLYTSDLYSINGIVPPIEEQNAIVSFINTKCSEIDSLIALKQQKIEELKEYKKSIIYEYVTGKKEIA